MRILISAVLGKQTVTLTNGSAHRSTLPSARVRFSQHDDKVSATNAPDFQC